MLNTVSLVGRLTKDAEIVMTSDNKQKASFTLAVQRTKDKCDFISCVAYDKMADVLNLYTKKGDLIGVTGSIREGMYTNSAGESKHFSNVAVANVYLLETKKTRGAEEVAVEEPTSQQSQYDSFSVDSDELPF